MRRFSERARTATVLSVVLASCVMLSLVGCEQLDGRNRVRVGNRMFRDTQFVDAAAEYQHALKEVDDPTIHYNLALAYSKMIKPGFDAPVLLGTKDESVCQELPGVRPVEAAACVKQGDRHYAECGAAKSAPLEKAVADLKAQVAAETDADKKKELDAQRREKEDELLRYTCASSFHCYEGTFCSMMSPELADQAAQHFQIWIKSQPSDDEIKAQLIRANKDLEEAKKSNNQSAISAAQRWIEELLTKDQTRKLMTRLWMDSEQHPKAIEYWEGLLKEKPDDTEIMGTLAGIWLSAGNWRKSIEWYNKVAELSPDASSKVAEYTFIGNVAWSRLNTKTLVGVEAIELADRGIAALQRGFELQPKNSRLVSLQASIFNFRSTAHGASWAAALDRATAQDLSKQQRVLAEEAKNAQQAQNPGTPGTPPAPGTAAAPAAAGSGSGAGSDTAGSAAGSAVSPASATPAPAPAAGSASVPPASGGTVEKSGG